LIRILGQLTVKEVCLQSRVERGRIVKRHSTTLGRQPKVVDVVTRPFVKVSLADYKSTGGVTLAVNAQVTHAH
jgi:hypothetical protein|tara:strand:- start:191 stop:409 length:219 start_codon:yes stop_codon:yes gene_type:complete